MLCGLFLLDDIRAALMQAVDGAQVDRAAGDHAGTQHDVADHVVVITHGQQVGENHHQHAQNQQERQ